MEKQFQEIIKNIQKALIVIKSRINNDKKFDKLSGLIQNNLRFDTINLCQLDDEQIEEEETDEETGQSLIPIYRTKIDSNKEELIAKTTAYNLNLYENNLYYFNLNSSNKDESKVCIYKARTDGKNNDKNQLKILDSYSSFLNIAKSIFFKASMSFIINIFSLYLYNNSGIT